MIDEYGIQHSFKSHEADDDALKKIERFRQPDAYRFSTTGWMDWTGVERNEFISMSLDRIITPSKSASSASRYGGAGLTEELSGHPDWSFYGSTFGK
jgi:hypothetical protein